MVYRVTLIKFIYIFIINQAFFHILKTNEIPAHKFPFLKQY